MQRGGGSGYLAGLPLEELQPQSQEDRGGICGSKGHGLPDGQSQCVCALTAAGGATGGIPRPAGEQTFGGQIGPA